MTGNLHINGAQTSTPSVQHISSTQKDHSFSAPEPFSSSSPSVHHQNPLSSTPKTPHFHTKYPSVQNQNPLCSTHTSVEMRGFWCGTEGRVELRGFWGLKRSGPFVWNWCVELRGAGVKLMRTHWRLLNKGYFYWIRILPGRKIISWKMTRIRH